MSLRRSSLAVALLVTVETGCLSLSDPTAGGRDAGIGGQGGSGGSVATGGSFPTLDGSAGGEDCLNGIDDDGNSRIDCADPACMPDYECVDVPTNWSAFVLNQMAWSNSLPAPAACASGTATRYFSGPAGPPQCQACSCDTAAGATCGDTPISCALGTTDCTGATPLSVATCVNFTPPANNEISCTVGATPASGAVCQPSTTALVDPNPWQSVADACPLVSGGCGAGQICVPKSAPSETVCVAKQNPTGCPATWSTAATLYANGSDTRSCSPCACSTESVSCDPDTFNFMTMAGCIDFGPYPTFSGSCKSYTPSSGTTWSIQRVPASNKSAAVACAPAGGVASGSMTPSEKTTFCCR